MSPAAAETTDARFAAVARRLPTRTALRDGDTALTYRALDDASDAVARRVRECTAPGAPVAVRMPRGADHVACVLGVWKAGSACLPVDPALPEEGTERLLGAGGAATLIEAPDSVRPLPGAGAQPAGASSLAWNDGSRDRTAYVFFTSGSTGAPKGVAVPHRGVLNEADWTHRAFSLTPEDVGTWLSSPAFAISRWELWPQLTCGAGVVIAEQGVEWSPETVRDWLLERRASTTILVTGLGERALGLPWPERCALRLMVLGGEQLRRWPGRVPFTVVNSYGATETSGARLTSTLSRDGSGLPPIGRPIANTTAYVLDGDGRPVAPGETGELHIGGVGLAHGYVGNPRLTAERFPPDPFRDGEGRMYRTGDLVRETPTGELAYVARAGADPKVGGARVDLGAVEAALLAHPGVDWAAATVGELAGTAELLAYVGRAEGAAPAPHELRASLAGRLPRHAVPTRFYPLTAPPTLVSGKLDRSALPGPGDAEELTDPHITGRDAVEERVRRLFGEVLGRPEVGVLDDFFALGGDSLGLARLRTALRDAFGRASVGELPELYTARTVREIAELVVTGDEGPAGERATDEAPADAADQATRRATLSLSGIQRGIWLEERDDPTGTAYLETLEIHLDGALDLGALQSALARLVDRQELLRTALTPDEPEPRLLVRPTACVVLPVVDADGTGDAELARPFDLFQGPLFRLLLRRHTPTEHVLVLVVHHLLWDGGSVPALLDELTAGYDRARRARAVDEPAGPVGYHSYLARERRVLAGPEPAAAVAHWRETLAGLPASSPAFAATAPAPEGADPLGVLTWTLSDELVAGMGRAAAGAGATVFALGAVAFATALREHDQETDPVLLIPVSLRRPAEEGTVGPYLSMIPLPVRLGGPTTARAALRDTTETLHAGMAHAAVPYAEVVRALRPDRTGGETPYGQFLFEVNRLPKARVTSDGVRWRTEWLPSRAPKFRLAMMWNETADGWIGRLEYDHRRLTGESAAAFVQDVERHALLLVREPHAPFPPPPRVPAARGTPATGASTARVPVPEQLRTVVEKAWSTVLETGPPADEDNFVLLGGASLEAARVLARIKQELGVWIPVRELFDSEDFADFAARVAAVHTSGEAGTDREAASHA
ncbi:non-ribosomal peptide synthetase [Streptomyces profundus]|uniref:non-ribosomal peptide synthetase n=1 Tax=Streptomyces profundus TaxID=2867410 RepID=UPI001D16ED06|nr:amino acid adenylation domain-containing protein [Streptomyces sp. MA3_2.13]UED87491.1 AMP-binding protein [Streptomyces sp. MA3_2.13]